MYIRQGIIIESLDLNRTQLSYDNRVPSDPGVNILQTAGPRFTEEFLENVRFR